MISSRAKDALVAVKAPGSDLADCTKHGRDLQQAAITRQGAETDVD